MDATVASLNLGALVGVMIWKGGPPLRAFLVTRSESAREEWEGSQARLEKARASLAESEQLVAKVSQEIQVSEREEERQLTLHERKTLERAMKYVSVLSRELRASLESHRRDQLRQLFQYWVQAVILASEKKIKLEPTRIDHAAMERRFFSEWEHSL